MSGLWFPSYAGIVHKKAASGGGGGTGPVSVPGCWCWYDASQSGDITKDGSDNVTEWLDHSGNGCHLTASGTDGPTYNATALGTGLPGIVFAGTKGLLNSTSAGLSAFKNRSAVWIIMAWRFATSTAGANYFQWTTNGSSSNNRLKLEHADASNNYWRFKKRTADSDSEFSADSASWGGVPAARNVFLIINIQYANAAAYMYQSYHGVATELLGASFANSNSTDDTESQASAFGGANGQTGMPYSLAEFLLYTETPSTANQAAIVSYLSSKWSIG